MKKIWFIPVITVALLLSNLSYGQTSWTKYSSSLGSFSINFPGAYEESTQMDTSDAGKPFKIHFASYTPNDDVVYMAGWIDMYNIYPADKSLKQILEDSRDGAMESLKATNIKTLNTSLVGEPYIEFTFGSEDMVGKERIYLINKFQYSIITLFAKTKVLPADADKFITSFKHL